MADWVVVSKESTGNRFYPAHIIANALNATRFDYGGARKQAAGFWSGKNVLFHFVWKGDHIKQWRNFYKGVAGRAKNFWIEFDADQHMNAIHSLDLGCLKAPFFLYRGLAEVSNQFIWELPMAFNPFVEESVRVPLRIYDRKWERKVTAKGRDIDFLGFIDHGRRNVSQTLHLLGVLKHKGYSVKCLIVDNSLYSFYKGKTCVELVLNGKFSPSNEDKFHGLLNRSKVFVDLSSRLTVGRVLYEALFNGCLSVCTNTYGASEYLFGEYCLDTTCLDMQRAMELCLTAANIWSVSTVKQFRDRANKDANTRLFVKELKELSK